VKIDLNNINLYWFLASQTMNSLGSFAIVLILFQLNFKKNIKIILLISFLVSAINYLLINAGEKIFASLLIVLVSFLYLMIMEKLSAFWSFVITMIGNVVIPLLIQVLIVISSLGFFAPIQLREHIERNYFLDILSGISYILIALLIHSQGWNFSFDFKRVQIKSEKYAVIAISFCGAILLPVTITIAHIKKIHLDMFLLTISVFVLFFLLFGYAIKKEKEEMIFLKGEKRWEKLE